MPGFRLDEKVALVTGCSIGLGHHFVETLHDAGATIVACARQLAELLEDLCKDLSRASWISADLGETAAREAIVPEVIDRHGRIDILVNNAGVGYPGRIETESLDDFRLALEVNVTAVWHLSKIAGAEMVAAGNGAIVNVASILGHVASAPMAQANYCASKGAIVNLTRERPCSGPEEGRARQCALSRLFPKRDDEFDSGRSEGVGLRRAQRAHGKDGGARRTRWTTPPALQRCWSVHHGNQPLRRRRLDGKVTQLRAIPK